MVRGSAHAWVSLHLPAETEVHALGRYGLLILGCEGIGASAVLLYGLTIIRCMPPDYVTRQIQPAQPGEGYDVQVPS